MEYGLAAGEKEVGRLVREYEAHDFKKMEEADYKELAKKLTKSAIDKIASTARERVQANDIAELPEKKIFRDDGVNRDLLSGEREYLYAGPWPI